MRKKRKEEDICRCQAYKFPHRFGGGNCDGKQIAESCFEEASGYSAICGSCNCLTKIGFTLHCSVADNIESPEYGECVQSFIHEKIK
jgi:hypothetical protein